MKTALTIAGSDCSGGAGIQADIKTMTACGVYASSAITSLTAQNTTGVYGIFDVPPEFLKKQLDCIFTDIYPDAVKIGMTATAETVSVISERLRFYKARNIVVDPVMVSTSGARLIGEEAAAALKERLFGLAILLTPNIPEAERFPGELLKRRRICSARRGRSAKRLDAQCSARADITETMQTTCCTAAEHTNGSAANGWRIPIRTEPAARFRARLPHILQKAWSCAAPCFKPRNILRER